MHAAKEIEQGEKATQSILSSLPNKHGLFGQWRGEFWYFWGRSNAGSMCAVQTPVQINGTDKYNLE